MAGDTENMQPGDEQDSGELGAGDTPLDDDSVDGNVSDGTDTADDGGELTDEDVELFEDDPTIPTE